jgi:hypothetical protein
MAFSPKNWQNLPNTTTKLNAAGLIDLEVRVTDYADLMENDANTYTDNEIDSLRDEPIALSSLITASNYNLQASDKGTVIRMNSGTDQDVTVPDSIFTAGDTVQVMQVGAGEVEIVAGGGVTLRSPVSSPYTIAAQYGIVQLLWISASECYISGHVA